MQNYFNNTKLLVHKERTRAWTLNIKPECWPKVHINVQKHKNKLVFSLVRTIVSNSPNKMCDVDVVEALTDTRKVCALNCTLILTVVYEAHFRHIRQKYYFGKL